MNTSLRTPAIPSSNDFSDINNANATINGIPPLPKKKQPQSMFVKITKASMQPLVMPTEIKGHCQDSHVIAQTEATSSADQTKEPSSCFQQLELNTLHADKHGYVTPLDPPTYIESNLPCSKENFPLNHNGGNASRFLTRDSPIFRLDSGVGEGESLQGSGSDNRSPPVYSSASLSNYPLSPQYEQHYEDIDHVLYNRALDGQHYDSNHQHSQRNGTSKQLVNKTQSEANRSISQLHVSGVTCSDSDDSNHANNINVLNSISGSLHDPVHTYMQLNTDKTLQDSQETTRVGNDKCQVIIALLVIFLISLSALGLSIHTVIFNSKQTTGDLDQTIITMQKKIDDLIKERDILIMQQKSLTSFVEEKITQASSQFQNLSYMIELVNDNLRTEIANISLTPGPQGVPGIVNFSLCINQSIAMSAPASATETTKTSFIPSLIDIQKYFVTFAYCTYSGATDAYLETQLDDISTRQRYRCKCWGRVSDLNYTLCKVVIWMCPQEN